jgi:ATP-binding cassette, subfamily C (CFTR/MRP), member 1
MSLGVLCHHHEGWGPVSRLRPFDLTPCFEEAVLFSFPLAFLIVLGLFRAWYLFKRCALQRTQKINMWFLWIKLVRRPFFFANLISGRVESVILTECYQAILGLVVSNSLVNLVIASFYPQCIYFFPSSVLEMAGFLVLPLLTYLNHTRTRRSSTIALLFWLAYFFALLVRSRTALESVPPHMPLVLTMRWATGGLGLVAFALECLGPEFRAEPDDRPRLNPESPLLTANIFSVWTFGWLTPLMKKGANQYITEDDLPELVPEDEATRLGQTLGRAMKKQ